MYKRICSYAKHFSWYHMEKLRITRLHSSRIRTARVLTVSLSMLCGGGCTWSGGVYLVPGGGVPGPRGSTWSWGVYLVPGGCNLVQRGVPTPGGVPGPGGGVPGPRGSTWSRGVYLAPGGGVRYSPCE